MGMFDEWMKMHFPNSIDTALTFYIDSVIKMEPTEMVRGEYLKLARQVLNAAPKHPRYAEYDAKLKVYEKS